MLENVLYYLLVCILLIVISIKFINRKDKSYILLICCTLLGFIIKFICNKNNINISLTGNIIIYLFSIVFPICIFILEYKNIYISERFVLWRTNVIVKFGRSEMARKKLVLYVTKFPNSYYAHLTLAEIYEREGKDEEAIDEYVRAVELNPKDYDSYFRISFLLNKNERQKESEQMLRDLLSKKPDYYKASDLLANIMYDQERFKEAVNIYNEALRYNPNQYELYYGLGMAYTRLNDFQTAKKYYNKAAELNSLLYHARFNMAQITLIMGELEEAEFRFTELLQNKDSEPEAYYYLAIIALLKNKKDKAVAYINIAIELDSKIYNKVCKQDIFKNIMEEVRFIEGRRHRYHMNLRELRTKKHLEDTFLLIDNLKNSAKTSGESKKRLDIEGRDRE